ncbi:amidase [Amycolatopsis nigrescens]|uniref:amidase n=1 Tax=Amycolatopsis nigrescens TaxID=381445 RepID=UPI000370A4B5|nr:amidase [Amycolatopsis nigrescens]
MRKRMPVLATAVLLSIGLVAPASAEPKGLGFDLDAATIPQLQARMDAHRLTSVRLTSAYLDRIRTVDGKVNAVLAPNKAALAEAAASDTRRRTGHSRGPLDGIPVLLKDNIDTANQQTTAGSRALRGAPPARDASLVSRLREAGAVVLGKANLSEWANFRAAKPTSGWSGVGGQTNNPYVLDRNPCGSSAGSAAGVAASLAQVAIGSETDGSIVCPAGMTGTVGHKPSLGLVSRTGVVPISAEQDTAGPMARHLVDVALTMSALQGRDPADPATGEYPADQPTDYAGLLRPDALRGARIGLWRLPVLGPETDAVMTKAAKVLTDRGAQVIEVDPPYQARLAELEFPALLTEFHRDIDKYLSTRTNVPRDLAALIEYNRGDPLEQTCFAGQELFEQALVAPAPDDPGYLANRAELTDLAKRSVDEVLAAHRLDAIAAPTNPPAWKTNCATGDNDVIPSSTPAAVAGYPAATVPAGFVGALPVGISFMAGRWADAEVLTLAGAFERAAGARQPPRYLKTTG